MKKKQISGFTLLELMIVVAIIGVIASMAAPSFLNTIERTRLKEAAESLKSDLLFAKTEAIKRSQNITVSVVKGTSPAWCYGINDTNSNCACGSVATANCGIKSINGTHFSGVNLTASAETTFGFRRGTATNIGPILSTSNYTVKVVVSGRGRVRICNITGSQGLPGYTCT